MNKKKTNIKIKKSKINIYNKRKAKERQNLTLVLTILIACVLGVVGYGIGKPIVNYFMDKDNGSDVSDSSQPVQSSSSDTAQSGGESSSSPVTSEPEPVVENNGMYILPSDVTASAESLNTALSAAKQAGYSKVAVTLKDESGVLHYKSEISRIKNDPNINAGTLSAGEICDIIEKSGMTPVARISTLKDSLAPYLFGSFTLENGMRWLDDEAAKGGKPWLSPYEASSGDYIGEICGELSAAGFKEIICVNVMFPPFTGYDKDTWLKHMDLRNVEKRYEALQSVLSKAKEKAGNGVKLWVEVDGKGLFNENQSGLDSELTNDMEYFRTLSVVVNYSATEEPSAAYTDAKAFAEKLSGLIGEGKAVIVLDGAESAGELTAMEKAFKEAGYDVSITSVKSE